VPVKTSRRATCREKTLDIMRLPPVTQMSGALLVKCKCPYTHWIPEAVFFRKGNRWQPSGVICFICRSRRIRVDA
jgi:hypothetical protein